MAKKPQNIKSGIYIPSIDAKDIYLASCHQGNNPEGYHLKLPDGQYSLRKFTNHFDYSLDLIELLDIYHKKYRRSDFSFQIDRHPCTIHIINLTFKYCVKEWNQINRNTFVKFGYDYRTLTFDDCIAKNKDGKIIGIQLGQNLLSPEKELPNCFCVADASDNEKGEQAQTGTPQKQYKKIRDAKVIKTNAQLRKELYRHGFWCDGIKYCRMKRSSGSARVGKCLFINEKLYAPVLKFSSGNITLKEGQEVDLAAYESYISLPSSSIIGTLPISPENILVIDDYESTFQEDVIETHNENGCLVTSEKRCEITNNIWDGQSLIDSSLMGSYSCYGMVLLRNLMFKSCCFNCNIQQWFRDNHITDISQLNGKTRAERLEDIKLITTPSSIKYLKFDTLDNWLDYLYPEFGVVKHDKKTHFFEGRLVQTHYQLINTLQLSEEEVREFLQESLDFAQLLRNNPAVVRYYIKYPDINEAEPMEKPMLYKNDVVYHLMCINDTFTKTKYYQEFLTDLLRAYYKNLKNGHVYVNGNYSTLLGNPVEMLQHAIGIFHGDSQMGIGRIHNTRFEYGKTLLGSRSPHVTMGNILLAENAENKYIDKYFNLTDEIVCINSIGENILQRLSGADFDSDTMLLTDNPTLIKAARRNYHLFKTPTAFVTARKVRRYYTSEEQADLDIKTSVNKIGEIINLSQELNSLLWDRVFHGDTYEDIKELYYDICQLDVMSGIEIDKAKKEFDINTGRELDKLRDKYEPSLREYEEGEDGCPIKGKKKMPHFLSHISRQKGYYNPQKKDYCKYNTSMDYLQTVVNGFKIRNPYKKDWLPFVAILDKRLFRTSSVNQKQINKIYSILKRYISNRKTLFMSELDKEERFAKSQLLYHKVIADIESENIGFSTLYRLLTSLEDKSNSSIKNVLLQILYLCGNQSFNKAILDSACEMEQLEPDGQDIKLFGIGYKVTKSRVHSEI